MCYAVIVNSLDALRFLWQETSFVFISVGTTWSSYFFKSHKKILFAVKDAGFTLIVCNNNEDYSLIGYNAV
jgi:hypothetical protein